MNPLARERRSRDTRPQPAWRHPATPCKAAQAELTPDYTLFLHFGAHPKEREGTSPRRASAPSHAGALVNSSP